MRRASLSSYNSGTFSSPRTPDHWDTSVEEVPKSWSSERVPQASRRRVVGASPLMLFNSGRALPSKWEDAERWITSPISGNDIGEGALGQPQRKPKSKSGPLGNPGTTHHSHCSPAVPLFGSENSTNLEAGSPFSAGLIRYADRMSIHYGATAGRESRSVCSEINIARSASLPGCSDDALSKSTLPSSNRAKKVENVHGNTEDAQTELSRIIVSRRDVATQMSPESSPGSSPDESPLMTKGMAQRGRSNKLEVRDVEVDRGATIICWSKKYGTRAYKQKAPVNEGYLYRSAIEAGGSSPWGITEEGPNNISKHQREEAKIKAWENLQKAKAEAAIRELEVNLEKKRSSSMDKILKKLKLAQCRAQEMRSSISEDEEHKHPKTQFHKATSVLRNMQLGILGGCFTSQSHAT